MSRTFDIVETITDILKQEFRRENVDVSNDAQQFAVKEPQFTSPVEVLVKLGTRLPHLENVDVRSRIARPEVFYFHRDAKKVMDAEERGLETILEAAEDFRKIGIDMRRVVFAGTTDEASQAGSVRGMPNLLKQTWDVTYSFETIDRTPITGGGVSPGGGPVSPPVNGGTSPPSGGTNGGTTPGGGNGNGNGGGTEPPAEPSAYTFLPDPAAGKYVEVTLNLVRGNQPSAVPGQQWQATGNLVFLDLAGNPIQGVAVGTVTARVSPNTVIAYGPTAQRPDELSGIDVWAQVPSGTVRVRIDWDHGRIPYENQFPIVTFTSRTES